MKSTTLTLKDFPSESAVKNLQETRIRSLGLEDPLEEEMATHSTALAWRIPCTEEPSGLQSMGSQRVGNDSETKQQQKDLLDLGLGADEPICVPN